MIVCKKIIELKQTYLYVPSLPSSITPIMATEWFRELGLYLW